MCIILAMTQIFNASKSTGKLIKITANYTCTYAYVAILYIRTSMYEAE